MRAVRAVCAVRDVCAVSAVQAIREGRVVPAVPAVPAVCAVPSVGAVRASFALPAIARLASRTVWHTPGPPIGPTQCVFPLSVKQWRHTAGLICSTVHIHGSAALCRHHLTGSSDDGRAVSGAHLLRLPLRTACLWYADKS